MNTKPRTDLTGQKFGRWTARKLVDSFGRQGPHWECVCECGTVRGVCGYALTKGTSVSCGCSHKLELVGQKFGRLTVIDQGNKGRGASIWICVCECGNYSAVRGSNLKTGTTKSCGCLNGRNNPNKRAKPKPKVNKENLNEFKAKLSALMQQYNVCIEFDNDKFLFQTDNQEFIIEDYILYSGDVLESEVIGANDTN